MVSLGILVLLTLDGQIERRNSLFPFYKAIGLPMTLDAIELTEADMPTLLDKCVAQKNWNYVPSPVTREQFEQAIRDTDMAAKEWLAANK